MLERTEKTRFRSWAATPNIVSLNKVGRAIRREKIWTATANPTLGTWKKVEEGMQGWRGRKGPERKSTSGSMMMMNGAVVKHWSRTQATRAMSTAGAEHHAVVTGAAEALGRQSMMADLELSAQVRVWTNSNAAKAIASRWGLGKTGIEIPVAAGGDQFGQSENEGGL